MKLSHKLLLLLGVALISYAVGRYLQPAKVVKEVREVEVERVRTEYRTVVRTITKPDGTTDVTETTENISVNENTNISESKTVIENLKPQWKAGLMVGTNSTKVERDLLMYGVQIERRILGPAFVGVWGMTNSNNDKSAGLIVSMEF